MTARVTASLALVLCAALAFGAETTTSDKFAQVRGFSVEITGAAGKEVDTAWEHVSGGELVIETTDSTVGSDRRHPRGRGRKSLEETVLKAAMRDHTGVLQSIEVGRCDDIGTEICLTLSSQQLPATYRAWLLGAVKAGRPIARDVTITITRPDGVERQYNLLDCFPTQWKSGSADPGNGKATETLTVKVGRIEFKPS